MATAHGASSAMPRLGNWLSEGVRRLTLQGIVARRTVPRDGRLSGIRVNVGVPVGTWHPQKLHTEICQNSTGISRRVIIFIAITATRRFIDKSDPGTATAATDPFWNPGSSSCPPNLVSPPLPWLGSRVNSP
jgi:hypothetical protein